MKISKQSQIAGSSRNKKVPKFTNTIVELQMTEEELEFFKIMLKQVVASEQTGYEVRHMAIMISDVVW